jgi:hypothetical protein
MTLRKRVIESAGLRADDPSVIKVPVQGARDGEQRHVGPPRLTRQICRSAHLDLVDAERTLGATGGSRSLTYLSCLAVAAVRV